MFKLIRLILKLIFFSGVFLGLLGLAYWQFERAEEKKALLASANQNTKQETAFLSSVKPTDFAQLPPFSKVSVTGHYNSTRQFLLDNQVVEKKLGVWVLTPFCFIDKQGKSQTVLVDRGFIEDAGHRENLPPFDTPEGQQTLKGQVFIPKLNRFISDKFLFEGKNSPWRMQSIRIADVAKWLETPLLPFVLTLSSGETGSFLVVPKLVTVMTPARHLGYAITWLGLALTWILLVGLFYRHERRHAK